MVPAPRLAAWMLVVLAALACSPSRVDAATLQRFTIDWGASPPSLRIDVTLNSWYGGYASEELVIPPTLPAQEWRPLNSSCCYVKSNWSVPTSLKIRISNPGPTEYARTEIPVLLNASDTQRLHTLASIPIDSCDGQSMCTACSDKFVTVQNLTRTYMPGQIQANNVTRAAAYSLVLQSGSASVQADWSHFMLGDGALGSRATTSSTDLAATAAYRRGSGVDTGIDNYAKLANSTLWLPVFNGTMSARDAGLVLFSNASMPNYLDVVGLALQQGQYGQQALCAGTVYSTPPELVASGTNAAMRQPVRTCRFQRNTVQAPGVRQVITCSYDNHELRFSLVLPITSSLFAPSLQSPPLWRPDAPSPPAGSADLPVLAFTCVMQGYSPATWGAALQTLYVAELKYTAYELGADVSVSVGAVTSTAAGARRRAASLAVAVETEVIFAAASDVEVAQALASVIEHEPSAVFSSFLLPTAIYSSIVNMLGSCFIKSCGHGTLNALTCTCLCDAGYQNAAIMDSSDYYCSVQEGGAQQPTPPTPLWRPAQPSAPPPPKQYAMDTPALGIHLGGWIGIAASAGVAVIVIVYSCFKWQCCAWMLRRWRPRRDLVYINNGLWNSPDLGGARSGAQAPSYHRQQARPSY